MDTESFNMIKSAAYNPNITLSQKQSILCLIHGTNNDKMLRWNKLE